MRPTLILQPIHNSSADILKCFAIGKPLSPEQVNYLDWHQQELSSFSLDPVLQYYLKAIRDHRHKYMSSFLIPHEELNLQDVQKLKKRIQSLLQQNIKTSHVVISLTQKQLVEFKEYTIQELIFWHGNQFLTGAPFYPGGIAPVIYFQWGNLFGIVKYVVLPGEKQLKANILVYFEDMQERELDQCVAEYSERLKNEIQLQREMLVESKVPVLAHDHEPVIETPRLRISDHFLIKHV